MPNPSSPGTAVALAFMIVPGMILLSLLLIAVLFG